MKEAGKWLAINGEAVYATRSRPGVLYAEGDHVRFTRTKDNGWIYVIMTRWPGREITLTSLRPKEDSNIAMLGARDDLDWSFDAAKGTVIRLPEKLQELRNRPCDHAWSLKVRQVST